MTGSLDAPPIGAMQDATTKATESVWVTEVARMATRTAELNNHFALTEAARMATRTAELNNHFALTEAARMSARTAELNNHFALTEAARMSARTAEFNNHFALTEAARMFARTAEFNNHFALTEAARMASQSSVITFQASAVCHTPTVEDIDLAAEVQDCAIELLALQIEEDLPEWLATNRSALARELAIAAHSFIVGFMRITARSPELYSPNSSDLTPLLLLPRN